LRCPARAVGYPPTSRRRAREYFRVGYHSCSSDTSLSDSTTQSSRERRTSWKLHTSTDPGSALALSTTVAFVRSRHRASTTLPFFSLDTFECQSRREQLSVKGLHTSGCMQRFLRLVNPKPVKAFSFVRCSSVSATDMRYSTNRFNSERAFSISGTVREQ
jgi:hypothetical protein